MKSLPRIAAIIIALALSLGLPGCSAIKLGYSTLPEVAFWWLDGYVDFSEEQGPDARRELSRLHDWHSGRCCAKPSNATPAQRGQATRRLRAWQRDLRELASAGAR